MYRTVRVGLRGRLLLLGVLAALPSTQAQPFTLPGGYRASVAVEGLQAPTQMTFAPDGTLWVAQLAGGENAGRGQVLTVDLETGRQTAVLDTLFKPTGLAVTATEVWVQAGNTLLRAPLGRGAALEPQVILRDLPNNGRSLGTLSLTPDGALLFETSGALSATGPTKNSGVLWRLEPRAPYVPQPLATGLKGAYAHTFAADGTLYATELGDDWMNGSPPPDELNVIEPGAAYGWPQCYGRQRPAQNTGGTEAICQQTMPPLALFSKGATPTSVVVSPFNSGELLVALWARSQVVRVDRKTGLVTPFIEGMTLPQHLLSDGDTLLVSSFGDGVIYRVSAR